MIQNAWPRMSDLFLDLCGSISSIGVMKLWIIHPKMFRDLIINWG